jgi:hypothetical protein
MYLCNAKRGKCLCKARKASGFAGQGKGRQVPLHDKVRQVAWQASAFEHKARQGHLLGKANQLHLQGKARQVLLQSKERQVPCKAKHVPLQCKARHD